MFRVLKFGLKAGIVTGAIYGTVDYGVWRDSETTTKLYNEIQTTVKPYLQPYIEQIPFEAPKLPKAGDAVSTGKVMWNKGVMATFQFLTEVPDLTLEYSCKGYRYLSQKINEQIEAAKLASNESAKES